MNVSKSLVEFFERQTIINGQTMALTDGKIKIQFEKKEDKPNQETTKENEDGTIQ